MLEPTEAAYLAGILDGEGTIYVAVKQPQRNKSRNPIHTVAVVISNTYLPLLLWVRDRCGGSIHTRKVRPTDLGKKPVSTWNLHGTSATALLQVLRPYLLIKAKRADIAIELQTRLGGFNGGRGKNRKQLTAEELDTREQLRREMRLN